MLLRMPNRRLARLAQPTPSIPFDPLRSLRYCFGDEKKTKGCRSTRRKPLLSLFGARLVSFVPALTAGIVLLTAVLDVAFAREFDLVTGKEHKACQEVLRRVNGPEAGEDVRFFLAKMFPKPPLREGFYLFRGANGTVKQPVNVGEFDINNDGRAEVLAFERATFRSDDGEQLLVFHKGEVDFFSQYPEFSYEQFQHLHGIRSFIPWPYMEHRLFLVTIGFWRFENSNYVVLWDNSLHDAGRATALVIAKYTGVAIQPPNGWTTDHLDVICKIM